MVQTGHHAYKQNVGNSVMSQDQILLKLYNGSLNFLRLARRGMEEKNPRIKGENISKVLAIMTELDCALDMETGGEIAENLSTLYQHMTFKLINANLTNDLKGLDEVENVLVKIKEGFEEAAKINRINNRAAQSLHPPVVEAKGGMSLAI